MTTSINSTTVDLTWTINDVLQRYPSALPVLHALGVHTCCGGGLTLDVAATRAGVAPDTLLREVQTFLGTDTGQG